MYFVLAYTHILKILSSFWHSGTYKKAAGAPAKLSTYREAGRKYTEYLLGIEIFYKKQRLSKVWFEQTKSFTYLV